MCVSGGFYRCANITLNVDSSPGGTEETRHAGGGALEHDRQAELFRKVCSEYVSAFDEADDSCFDEPVSGSHQSASVQQAGDQDGWDPRAGSSDDEDNKRDSPTERDADREYWRKSRLTDVG